MFTCPFSGVYSVNVHLEEKYAGGVFVDAMLDSDVLFDIHIHDDSIDHGTTATSVMVGCNKGQQIYLLNKDSGGALEVQNTQRRSIFSIFLVQAMSDVKVQTGNMLGS